MSIPPSISRRQWLGLAAGLAAATALPRQASAAAPAMPKVCIFSKHLQFLDYPALAKAVKGTGADGADLTLRPGGHVLPEHAERDLPRVLAAFREQGLEIPMVSTKLIEPSDAHTAPTFAACAANGVRFVRIGSAQYSESGNLEDDLKKIIDDCRAFTALAEKHGLTLGYHNHSGERNFGAPVWDLLRAIEAIHSPAFGSNFDIGHCMVEGPFGDWPLTARALAPHTRMMAVKDFVFDGAKPRWVELGKGVVQPAEFFKIFRAAGFSGPLSVHFEYAEYQNAAENAKLDQMKAAVTRVREALAAAGYPA